MDTEILRFSSELFGRWMRQGTGLNSAWVIWRSRSPEILLGLCSNNSQLKALLPLRNGSCMLKAFHLLSSGGRYRMDPAADTGKILQVTVGCVKAHIFVMELERQCLPSNSAPPWGLSITLISIGSPGPPTQSNKVGNSTGATAGLLVCIYPEKEKPLISAKGIRIYCHIRWIQVNKKMRPVLSALIIKHPLWTTKRRESVTHLV